MLTSLTERIGEGGDPRFRRAMERSQCRVFMLRDVDGLSVEETAEAL
jgi:hypothetical protein